MWGGGRWRANSSREAEVGAAEGEGAGAYNYTLYYDTAIIRRLLSALCCERLPRRLIISPLPFSGSGTLGEILLPRAGESKKPPASPPPFLAVQRPGRRGGWAAKCCQATRTPNRPTDLVFGQRRIVLIYGHARRQGEAPLPTPLALALAPRPLISPECHPSAVKIA